MARRSHLRYVCIAIPPISHLTDLQKQFSDEFETDGRTFYDGDDAYFQGVDIWYGVTGDLEVSFVLASTFFMSNS
jgi:hypothetical protein